MNQDDYYAFTDFMGRGGTVEDWEELMAERRTPDERFHALQKQVLRFANALDSALDEMAKMQARLDKLEDPYGPMMKQWMASMEAK